MSSEVLPAIRVTSVTQRIVVNSDHSVNLITGERSVSVINAGPIGPPGIQGVPGDTGPEGPQGPQGPIGAQGGYYTHEQNSPSDTWVIVHNLGFYPAVTVIDSAGSMVEGDVQYDDLNQVTLSFSGPFGGIASLS